MTPTPQGRLQRPAASDGFRIATFSQVMRRHGLTMGAVALVCVLLPGAGQALMDTTAAAVARPWPYLAAALGILLFFWFWNRRAGLGALRHNQWVLYLLYISIVEEVAFRLLLPGLLSAFGPVLTAHIISNLLFALIHYFTLRWRITNCVVTFFGGMGLSYMLLNRGDLAALILVHWFFTFLNTPRPPDPSR